MLTQSAIFWYTSSRFFAAAAVLLLFLILTFGICNPKYFQLQGGEVWELRLVFHLLLCFVAMVNYTICDLLIRLFRSSHTRFTQGNFDSDWNEVTINTGLETKNSEFWCWTIWTSGFGSHFLKLAPVVLKLCKRLNFISLIPGVTVWLCCVWNISHPHPLIVILLYTISAVTTWERTKPNRVYAYEDLSPFLNVNVVKDTPQQHSWWITSSYANDDEEGHLFSYINVLVGNKEWVKKQKDRQLPALSSKEADAWPN